MSEEKLRKKLVSQLSEFNIWCLCGDRACVKSQNFDVAVAYLIELITKEIKQARIDEVVKIRLARDSDRDFHTSQYIDNRLTTLNKD